MAENKARRKRRSDKAANGIRTTLAGHRHVLIAGSGIAGLSLALALSRACPEQLEVTVCDPALPARAVADARDPDERTRLCCRRSGPAHGWRGAAHLGGKIAGEAQSDAAYMVITDSHLATRFRPAFLQISTSRYRPRRGVWQHMVARTRPLAAWPPPAARRGSNLARVVSRAPLHSRYRRWRRPCSRWRNGYLVNLCVAAGRGEIRGCARPLGIGGSAGPYSARWAASERSPMSRDSPGGRCHRALSPHPEPFARWPLTPDGTLGIRSSIALDERRDIARALLARERWGKSATKVAARALRLEARREIVLETP